MLLRVPHHKGARRVPLTQPPVSNLLPHPKQTAEPHVIVPALRWQSLTFSMQALVPSPSSKTPIYALELESQISCGDIDRP